MEHFRTDELSYHEAKMQLSLNKICKEVLFLIALDLDVRGLKLHTKS